MSLRESHILINCYLSKELFVIYQDQENFSVLFIVNRNIETDRYFFYSDYHNKILSNQFSASGSLLIPATGCSLLLIHSNLNF